MQKLQVAFIGKGGSGKSSISGTFARLLARRGEPVLALDSDPLPGMAYALGIEVDDTPLPDDLVVEGPEAGPRFVLRPGLDAATVIDRHAAVCPDNVRYMQFGNVRGHVRTMQRAQFAWSQVVKDADRKTWHLVGDLPGGTRQAMSGWATYGTVVLIVVEPSLKSLHTGSRLLNLARAQDPPRRLLVVANKVAGSGDVDRIASRLDTEVFWELPLDVGVARGDRLGLAPLDAAAAGPFVNAIRGLLDRVVETEPALPVETT